MATILEARSIVVPAVDRLSGTPRAHAIDRWIFVFMAAWFIVIVLTGFIPDSIMKVGMVQAGQRPPFPLILHLHALLMGSFLLVLLTQTWMMATGRAALHMQLGIAGVAIGIALVVAGFVLAPTMYHMLWHAAQIAPAEKRDELLGGLNVRDDILLLQLRVGILFSLFLVIGLKARAHDAGLHKRMMILATAMPLVAGIDRISWLPSTMPGSPMAGDLYTLLAVSPMFVWDVIRNRSVHPAYLIWLAGNLPFAFAVHKLWDTPWWHQMAHQIMGVG